MQSPSYHGYDVWGHAIPQQEDILQSERYAAKGTIAVGRKLIEASGVGYFDTEGEAQHAGLNWARAWIDSHG